jgi:hypothetical protein
MNAEEVKPGMVIKHRTGYAFKVKHIYDRGFKVQFVGDYTVKQSKASMTVYRHHEVSVVR